jgi:hypothetical protein
MARKTVTVTLSDGTLTIEQDWRELMDGDWVEWKFLGLEKDQFGFISFAPPLLRLGPFYSLRSFGYDLFLGKGNKGPDANRKDYPYKALVLSLGAQEPVAAADGTIRNEASAANTAPEITVEYKKEEDAEGRIVKQWLEVRPDPVGLNTGDTATWHFENLPENAFACFQFTPPAELQLPVSGPFLAFNACVGEGTVTVEASGMGFIEALSEEERLKYRQFVYYIQLRNWDGQLLASHEPIIDNLGPPAPGGNRYEGSAP